MVLNGMEQVHPGARDNFEVVHRSVGVNDPYPRGALWWFRPGEMAAKRGLSAYNWRRRFENYLK